MLVKVHACGICGSDIVEWYRLPRAPLVQGHEIGAEVVSVGEGVQKYAPGDRVFIPPKIPCGECVYCRAGHYPQCTEIKERLPGGFAEYILVPRIFVDKGTYLLPENVSYERSTFIEPVACAVRAQRLAGVEKDKTILVLGSGMSGLIHVKLAAARGSKVFAVDINPAKLEMASRMGAYRVINGNEDVYGILMAENGRGADIVVLASSARQAVGEAWRCVDKGGTVVLFAVPGPDEEVVVPVNHFWTRETTILTSYYCGPPDIDDALELIGSGTLVVDDLITHRLPLDEIVEGFRLVLEGRESVKVIIKPVGV